MNQFHLATHSFLLLAEDFLLRMCLRSHAACSRCHHACPTAPTIPASSPGHFIFLPQHLERNLTSLYMSTHICIYAYIYEWDQTHSSPSPRQPSLSLSLSLALMAFLLNKLSLVVLLFLATFSLKIHARESRFLMKATRPEDPKEATRIPEETPAVKTEEAPRFPAVQGLSGRGRGLYGHGQEQFTPTTTTNYYNNNARPNANTFPSSFPDAELTSESYDKGGYNYGNHFNNANNSPSKFSNEEFNSRSYETKEYNNYVDNKQYGMSDTRLLENGRYFYDVNAEKNRNQYGTYPTRGNPEAGVRVGNYGNGVYGNGNANGYNNAMEYQNNQVNRESQEEYVP